MTAEGKADLCHHNLNQTNDLHCCYLLSIRSPEIRATNYMYTFISQWFYFSLL